LALTALSEINVAWNISDRGSVAQAPAQLTSLFYGERQIAYGFVDYCTSATLRVSGATTTYTATQMAWHWL
jgi:hypothetical protein